MTARKTKEISSEDMFNACREGNEMLVKEWAMDPENEINSTDQHGFTPLHYACAYGHIGIVDYLLGRGARNDIVNMGGDSALHMAASNGKYDAVVRVLRSQPDPNLANEHGNTPLHYASFWNYIGICELLVKQGALIALSNKTGDTPYTKARPTLKRKLQGLAEDSGQSLESIPYRKLTQSTTKKIFMEFRQRQMEIELRQLTISLKMGEDFYGELWKGSWSGHTVQIKKLKAKEDVFSSQNVQESFPREYPRLKILTQENLSPLLAVVLEPQVHLIGMLFPIGTLYHVLHDLDSDIKLNLQEGVTIAAGISAGMKHIHTIEPLVNRFNLNPHNVLIDPELTPRLDLSQYRFSFMDSQTMYYPQWCSPEYLSKRSDEVDKRAADMYSFAIVLWEIVTGKVPFASLSTMKAGLKIGLENARPIIPNFVNSHLQRVIDICWNIDPLKRPKFDRIQPIIQKLNLSDI